jgi:flagellar FliL protein
MKRLFSAFGWIVAQSAFAVLLAVFVIGPAVRGDAFFWQKERSGAEDSHSEDPAADESSLDRGEARGKKKDRALGTLLPIESVIVNVAQTQGRRFLKASLTLELDTKEAHEAQARLPILRGVVIDVLASKNLDELVAPDAREVIRDEILAELAEKTGNLEFQDLYFTEFIVQ